MDNITENRNNTEVRLQNTDDGKIFVFGRAITFNSLSDDLGGFYEIIDKNAITEDLLKRSTIICKLNHDDSKVLAVYREGKGSLQLQILDDGLYYRFELGKTQAHEELKEHFQRGEINGSSFAFTVKNDGTCDNWSRRVKNSEGIELPLRTITKFMSIIDVSPVFNPAYRNTETTLFLERKLNQIKGVDEKLNGLKSEFENL